VVILLIRGGITVMAKKRGAATAAQAFDQVVEFLESFEALEDHRQRAKVLYPLDEILLLVLLGVLAGCESWVEIAKFGEAKLDLLRRFRPFEDGTPSHDQLGDIFAALDAAQFQSCFIAWVGKLTGLSHDIIAIDGKTLRRSYQEGGAKAPIHMISAWSAGQGLVLGQAKVADKSNEITAIPQLLDLLTIKGSTITIDAMGCQREIAAKIIEKEADYVLALKGNQGTLRQDVELFFTEQKARTYRDCSVDRHETVEKSHGRIETRIVTAIGGIGWLQERHKWPGLVGIVMVESRREIGARTEREFRFYITSLGPDAERLGEAIRGHWSIENGLHWVMDMVFRDDECRIRKDNAPANFSTIKHMASNLLRRAPGKDSLRVKRKMAAWDDSFLASLVARN
jgi:predicted transposase YbfD/YdcC